MLIISSGSISRTPLFLFCLKHRLALTGYDLDTIPVIKPVEKLFGVFLRQACRPPMIVMCSRTVFFIDHPNHVFR